MSSQSESEGEIIETEHEKATSANPSTNYSAIDRPARRETPDSSASSFSGHLNGHRNPQPSRSRSRSPFRARSPRGEKRRRDDDSFADKDRRDARRFKVHYEDRRQHHDRRAHVSYADIDRNEHLSHGNERGGRYSDRDRRSRTRSRSPYRHERRDNRGRNDRPDRSEKRDRDRRKDDDYPRSKAQTGTARYERASVFLRGGEASDNAHKASDKRVSFTVSNGNAEQTSSKAADPAPQSTSMDIDEPAEPAVVDEAALIEERRKRREAIKAKFKGQTTPLLVQALQLGSESGSVTPKVESPKSRDERSVSPMPSTPATPKHDSAPDSPTAFAIQNDDDLANHLKGPAPVDDAEGPSAADYDPTMDMQEDRAREDLRHHSEQASADYNETMPDQQDMLLPSVEAEPEKPAKSSKKEFDMFADDDDEDDMFAESPKATVAASAPSKALPIPQELEEPALDLRDNWDDQDGYYRFNPRDALDGRYRPQTNLGRGMFSAVFRATDVNNDAVVAIKIIRNNETMRKAGFKEIEILKKLAAADPEDRKHIVRLVSNFEHRGHLCMVFENLSMNLREVLKKFGRDVGINLKAVRPYAQQMFLGLGLLKKCNILHADIKPDNILVNDSRNILKICDLGSAGDASENEITPYLVSRFYRAPEIILGMEYGFPIDMWSIGCTLFELYTGKILFTGRSNNQMLKAIMECRGKFPVKMLNKGELRYEHFDANLETFRSMEKDKVTGKEVTRMININKPTKDLKSRVLASSKGLLDADMRELNLFIDLLDRCLQLNPERRCTPNEALKHPFILRAKN